MDRRVQIALEARWKRERVKYQARVPPLRPIASQIQHQPCDARRLVLAANARMTRRVERNASSKVLPENGAAIQGQNVRARDRTVTLSIQALEECGNLPDNRLLSSWHFLAILRSDMLSLAEARRTGTDSLVEEWRIKAKLWRGSG